LKYIYISLGQIYPDQITISGRQPRPSRLQPHQGRQLQGELVFNGTKML
jgi:hypothetical protein